MIGDRQNARAGLDDCPLSVQAYLARLPNGLDAYPEAQVKGSLFAQLAGDTDKEKAARLVPARLGAPLFDPPAPSAWQPEAHFQALAMAVYEASFSTAGVPAWERWVYEQNRALLKGPLYRILFAVLSPERIGIGVGTRWAAFRRGSSMDIVDRARGALSFRLTAPAHLVSELGMRATGCGIRVALELAGAKLVQVASRALSPTEARFDAHWI